MSEIIRIVEAGTEIHLVTDDGADPLRIAFINSDAFGRGECACICQIRSLIGFPVIIDIEYQRLCIGEYISAGIEPGIPFHIKQIAQGRKNIQRRKCCCRLY